MAEPYLQAEKLYYSFRLDNRIAVKAVNGVDLTVNKGEIVSLVGGSGCGKSTLARLLTGIYKPRSGRLYFNGKDLTSASFLRTQEGKELSGQRQLLFQDSTAAMNQRFTVRQIIEEPFILRFPQIKKEDKRQKIGELLYSVSLDEAILTLYPWELSGGQRQRVCIARALALNPGLLVADEPLASLDVSVQAQMVNLLQKLRRENNLTIVFIAHDLSMVRYISDNIAVMNEGKIIEQASAAEIFNAPKQPYTRAMLKAVPKLL